MAVVAANDIWAVGKPAPGATTPEGSVEHWDGANWNVVPAPFQGALSGVTAVASDPVSVWIVGSGADAMAARWNGIGWNVVDVGPGKLVAAAAVSATNVWAVGSQGSPPTSLVEHYDGTTWSEVVGGNMPDQLFSVAASSPSDVWATGSSHNGTVQYSALAHWDGTRLSGMPSPDIGMNDLNGIAASSSTAAWAVGDRFLYSGNHVIVDQWDGRSWTLALDQQIGAGGSLSSVAATGPANIWAAGWFISDPQAGNQEPLIEHWQGKSWRVIPSANSDVGPAYFNHKNVLTSIVAASPTSIWAAGGHGQSLEQPLFENLCIGPPTVSGVAPLSGNASRGTAVTIAGTGFTYATGVSFGATPAASFTVDSDSRITAAAPPEVAGAVDVTVTGYGGTSAASVADLFVFVPPAVSWQQYRLSGSDGVTWQPIDRNRLSLNITPAVDSNAILTANADLWTAAVGVNQDLGITISGGDYGPGQVVGWKESGGAGTFSPNAVTAQLVAGLQAGITYTVTLDWKTNHATGASIFVGAGAGSPFSPTRLTAELVATSQSSLQTVASTQQYRLSGSDGSTWRDLDSTGGIIVVFTPTVSGSALISANADLWTQDLGLNQDLGIWISGGAFGEGELLAWKESGGGATFSPNAAFLQTQVPVSPATMYIVKIQWKANHATAGTIRAGAGLGPAFSPTRLTVLASPAGHGSQQSTDQQYWRDASSGTDWTAIDSRLAITITAAQDSLYTLTANVDLWTDTAGINQDVGIAISGGLYRTGVLLAWKESGGYAGTFSPNASFVEAVVPLAAGSTYTVTVAWKPNRASPGKIYAGAGPYGQFSPTLLSAQVTR